MKRLWFVTAEWQRQRVKIKLRCWFVLSCSETRRLTSGHSADGEKCQQTTSFSTESRSSHSTWTQKYKKEICFEFTQIFIFFNFMVVSVKIYNFFFYIYLISVFVADIFYKYFIWQNIFMYVPKKCKACKMSYIQLNLLR